MSDREVVEQFYQQNPQWNRQANTGLLLERAARPVTVEGLAAAAHLLREHLLLAPDYEEAWEDEKERLLREQELDHRSYGRSGQIGIGQRLFFIEQLREKEIKAAALKEYETLITQLGEKFRGQSIERLREVAEKRRVRDLTASQFREERAAQAPKEKRREYDDYPMLPDYLALPGDVQQTKIDAAFLSRILKTDYYIYRRLFNKYGGEQLTDRQRGVQ